MPKEIIATDLGQIVVREYKEKPLQLNGVLINSELSAEKHGTTLTFMKGLSPYGNKVWNDELELFVPRKKER